jgi:hypothetical protein
MINPCMSTPWIEQKYVYVFVSANVRVKTNPLLCTPESHGVQPVQGGPGVHEVAEQVPDVVEWMLPIHCHSTVSPALIVVVLLPLIESTNCVPPWPTNTMWFGLGVGVAVVVRVTVGVSVTVAVPLPVVVGVRVVVAVAVVVAVLVPVNVGGFDPVRVGVTVRVTVGVLVCVEVGVVVEVREGVNVCEAVKVCDAVNVSDGVKVCDGVSVIDGVSVMLGVGDGPVGVRVGVTLGVVVGPPPGVRVRVGGPGCVGVCVATADWSAEPVTRYGSLVALSMTAA